MAEDRIVTDTPHTTIIERRSGVGGILLIALVLVAALALGGFYLLNQSRNDNARTAAITDAAKDVGDSAKKVGDSASKAIDDAAQ